MFSLSFTVQEYQESSQVTQVCLLKASLKATCPVLKFAECLLSQGSRELFGTRTPEAPWSR